MVKYRLIVIIALGLALCLTAGFASAECGKDCAKKGRQDTEAASESASGAGCHSRKCEHKPRKDCKEEAEIKTRGTVRSIDPDKGEMVFSPEGEADEIPIVIEKSYAAKIKAGDNLLVTYEKRRVNVATRVLKQFSIKKLPNPCVPPEKYSDKR